jgi:hypothetical protein
MAISVAKDGIRARDPSAEQLASQHESIEHNVALQWILNVFTAIRGTPKPS